MDKNEAREILEREVESLRRLSRSELLTYLEAEHRTLRGPTGAEYMVETQAFWDDARVEENLRVIVTVAESEPSRRIKWESVAGGFLKQPGDDR